MKIHVLFASIGLAVALPIPALAAESHQQGGHYEWRPVPQFGPQTTGPVQKRVWVSDSDAQTANCDCDMMKMSANECRMPMHHMDSSKSGRSAGWVLILAASYP